MSTKRLLVEVAHLKHSPVHEVPIRDAGPGWRVRVYDATRATYHFRYQAIAQKFAVDTCNHMARNGHLVELQIKRRDNTIRDKRTYPRSSDPRGRG